MPTYEHTASIDAAPDEVFAFVSDVRKLPNYVPGMTAAEPADGDRVILSSSINGNTHEAEGWFRVNRPERVVEWGSTRRDDYHGRMLVASDADGSSLTLSLTLPKEALNEGDLQKAIRSIADALAPTGGDGP